MKAAPISILHIGKFYPPHRGGMETHLRDLVRHQRDRFDLRVLVSSSNFRSSTESLDGAVIHRAGRYATIASMPVSPAMLLQPGRLHPDLVHLHVPNPLGALSILTSGFRGSIVVTHHSDTLGRRTLRRLTHPILRSVYDRAALIIATSERYLATSEELSPYRHKCRVIPIGIDLDSLLSPDMEKGATRGQRPLLLSIGRLVPYKGFEYLIDAMPSLDADLIIIGDGPLRESLLDRIERARAADRVRIIPRADDVRPYLRSCDLFVLPSITRAEAFGVVQLEAMAFGVPIVNTAIDSGVPEVSVDRVTGITVPPRDAAALASAIARLMEDGDLRRQYGEAAQRRAVELYSARTMAARVAALYDEVLAGRSH